MSISQKYARSVNCLKDENRDLRLSSLNDLHNLFKNYQSIEQSELKHFVCESLSSILLLLSDPISQIRIKTISIIETLFTTFLIDSTQLFIIFPSLYNRLNFNNTHFMEPIEETRILLMKLISYVSLNFNINPYYSELFSVLTKLTNDQNPDMKEAIGEFCISLIVKYKTNPSTIEQISLSCKHLVIALCKNANHQRNKIRKVTLIAICQLTAYTPSILNEITPVLRKSLTDKNSEVRLSCYESISELIMTLNITYLNKYESILVSFIMIGLGDEVENISSFCFDSLDKIGAYRRELGEKIENEQVEEPLIEEIIEKRPKENLNFELKTKNDFNLNKLSAYTAKDIKGLTSMEIDN